MVTKEFTVKNPTGIHARPATELVKLANSFPCALKLTNRDNGKVVDPKSIFSILSAAIKPGTAVTLQAEGPEEGEAANRIAEFIEQLEE